MRWAAVLGPSGTGKTTLTELLGGFITCIPGTPGEPGLNPVSTPATRVFIPRVCGGVSGAFGGILRIFWPEFPGMQLAKLHKVAGGDANVYLRSEHIPLIAEEFGNKIMKIDLNNVGELPDKIYKPIYDLLLIKSDSKDKPPLYNVLRDILGVSEELSLTEELVKKALSDIIMSAGSRVDPATKIVSWGATLAGVISSLLHADLIILTFPATLEGWTRVAGDRLQAYGGVAPERILAGFYSTLASLLDRMGSVSGKRGVRVLLLFTMLDLVDIDSFYKDVLKDLAHLGEYFKVREITKAIELVYEASGISNIADVLSSFLHKLSKKRHDDLVVDIGFSWREDSDSSRFMHLYLAWFAKYGDNECSIHSYVINSYAKSALSRLGHNNELVNRIKACRVSDVAWGEGLPVSLVY